jgi:hypothetical protein
VHDLIRQVMRIETVSVENNEDIRIYRKCRLNSAFSCISSTLRSRDVSLWMLWDHGSKRIMMDHLPVKNKKFRAAWWFVLIFPFADVLRLWKSTECTLPTIVG